MKVYVARAEGKNLWKVGQTTGKVESRISSLQTGCPYTLEIYEVLHSNEAWNYEKVMHEILERNSIEDMKGEWFRTTQYRMDRAIKQTKLQGASNKFWSAANDSFSEEERTMYNRWRHHIWQHADQVRCAIPRSPDRSSDEINAEWVRENAEWIAGLLSRSEKKVNKLMEAISFIPFMEDWPGC
jgi:hypothetical protein